MSGSEARRTAHLSRTRLLVMFAAGVAAAAIAAVFGAWLYAPVIGWAVACITYMAWVWLTIWPMDADDTATHATIED